MWRDKPLKSYEWQGVNRHGEAQSGSLDAASYDEVKQQLHQQGILVRLIRRKINFIKHRCLKPQTLSICFRQLATSLKQGMPILHLLESMAIYQTHERLKDALKKIHQDLSRGCPLFEALKRHPLCFSELTCLWVQMGEQYGTLPEVLQHIADYYMAQAHFKQRLRKALTYPLTVLLMATLVSMGLMIIVVPQFATFYRYFGADMPWATQYLIQCAQNIKCYGLMFGVMSTALLYFLRHAFKNHRPWIKHLECTVLALPFLGRLLKLNALTRIVTTLRMTYMSGLPLIDAFQAAQCVAGYVIYSGKIAFMLHLLRQGEPLRMVLQRGQLFPTFVVHLLSLGEETSTLIPALQQITTYYEQEIERSIYTFTTVFEPLLMALLGIGLGGLIIALYLPILNLGSIL